MAFTRNVLISVLLAFIFPHTASAVSDPFYDSFGSWGQSFDDLWGLKNMNMEDAWELATGKDVLVAVIDSGIDNTHPDIDDGLWVNDAELNGEPGVDDDGNGFIDDIQGWDLVSGDNAPGDPLGYGTHISGIIAAEADGEGTIGVAYGAKLLSVRAVDDGGNYLYSNVAPYLFSIASTRGKSALNIRPGLIKTRDRYSAAKGGLSPVIRS
ncbi:MAG: S8 family serine peptidase, partial [Candidatus Omnitrophica bacterium]|nr:S8 family serine peptidase [Candidatus Omnitrophota bacterium]